MGKHFKSCLEQQPECLCNTCKHDNFDCCRTAAIICKNALPAGVLQECSNYEKEDKDNA